MFLQTAGIAVTPAIPPHSREAEEAVIGAVLINAEAYYDVAHFLKADDFYIHRHKFVWEAFTRLHEKRAPIDLVTLPEELERVNKLSEVGGSAYITSLINQAPSSLDAESYGRIVHAYSIRRKILKAANEIATLAYNGAMDIDAVTEQCVSSLEKAVSGVMGDGLVHISEPFSKMYDEMMTASQKNIIPGIPTNIRSLDAILGNLKPGLYIVAGRPGHGKTAFKLSVAKNVAKNSKKRVAIFSLEMPSDQIMQRLTANETGIELDIIRSGLLTKDQWQKVNSAAEFVQNLPMYIDETPEITCAQIEARCKRLIMMHGALDLVIVDYLQLMSAGFKSAGENRAMEVGAISRGLHNVSRRLNVPIIAGAQVNREGEKEGRRPRLSDLRESGSIEADADVVIFPYEENGRMTLIVEKHRNGPTGDAEVKFIKPFTRFTDD